MDRFMIQDIFSGPLFLKVLISSTNVDTRATCSYIRRQMAALPHYITTINSDIAKFNQHVRQLRATLHAHGEESTDRRDFLFAAYTKCADPYFVDYIRSKKNEWDEGTRDFTVNQLLKFAEMKQASLIQEGLWKQPSKGEQELSAMSAQTNSNAATKDSKDNAGKTLSLIHI